MDKETFDPDGCRSRESSSDTNVCYVDFNKKSQIKDSSLKKIAAIKKTKLKQLPRIKNVVSNLKPSVPVYFSRPNSIKRAASWFIENFSGFSNLKSQPHRSEILYSVKSNPDEKSLKYLFQSGISHFDVASLNEIKMINGLFGDKAKMYFMHPIKSREAIEEAYFQYGIRDFSLDSADELKKILDVTKNAKDLGLHLRMAIPNSHSAIDLSGKFGIRPSEAVSLSRKIRAHAKRFGICFHVGSQCMDPTQYRAALSIVKELLVKAKIDIDVLDVGGGFPSIYPGMTPPAMTSYIEEIRDAVKQLNLRQDCIIWCEPGRALVADSGSLLVRVEARKNNMLYINDGTYGGLFDAGFPAFIFPCEAIRTKRGPSLSSEKIHFGFYGPTCDSLDVMRGPFYLPKNINEGDYIEVGQLGAYSKSIRTDFNGFNDILQIEVEDEPSVSMYFDAFEEEKSEEGQK